MTSISSLSVSAGGAQAAAAARTDAATSSAVATASGQDESARVSLSAAGRSLASLPDLMLPNPVTVRQLATDLARMAGKIFREAAIAPTPPVQFRVDGAGGIHVEGERNDKTRIGALLAEKPELAQAVRDLNAISSHAHAIHTQGQLEFSAEYQASSNPQAVVAKYGHLFSGMLRNETSIVLDGGQVDVVGNGQRWITSA